MVYIITGRINSGKTSKLMSIYKNSGAGDGFVLPKAYIDGIYVGQRIVRLSTGEERPFSYLKGYTPPGWDQKYSLDVYSFSADGFGFAASIVSDIVRNHISPAFVDEIGLLELRGEGFSSLLLLLLSENRSIYMAVREDILEKVVCKFNITDYSVIVGSQIE